jgi:hypothetical protein
VNEHHADVNRERDLDAALRDLEVRPFIKDAGGEQTDEDFDRKKKQFAGIKQLRHQPVAFGCESGAHPDES